MGGKEWGNIKYQNILTCMCGPKTLSLGPKIT